MGKENRESKPDRKVRPDQTPTHPHAVFPALASPACLCFAYAM